MAAIRMLFDHLVTGAVREHNPALPLLGYLSSEDTTNCQLVPVGTRALASLNTPL
jgi:hypothetical protein